MQILSASHKTKEVEDFERMLKRYVPILLAALLLLSVSCSNDTSPPQTENPGGGSSHHTGNTISTGAQFMAALASSGTYSVTEDITVTTDNPLYRIRNQDIVIDLGGHTVTSDVLLDVVGSSLTLKNGTINFHNTKNVSGYAFHLFSQGTLELDGITMTSEFGGIEIKNGVNDVKLGITNNSTVVSKGGFTIAYEERDEKDAISVVINIMDSNITAVDDGSQDYNTTAFLINCSATVNVSDSTFTGDRQAYVARAGNHTLKNTKLYVTGKYKGRYIKHIKGLGSAIEPTLWGDSNDVPNGGLIIGGNNLSYQFPVTVKVDESVEILMEDVNDIGYYGFFGTIVMHTEEYVEDNPYLGIEPYEAVDVYLIGRPTIKVGEETTERYCCISNILSDTYW